MATRRKASKKMFQIARGIMAKNIEIREGPASKKKFSPGEYIEVQVTQPSTGKVIKDFGVKIPEGKLRIHL